MHDVGVLVEPDGLPDLYGLDHVISGGSAEPFPS
jgi:hypothetical protein